MRKVQFISWFPDWQGIRKKEWCGFTQLYLDYSILIGWFEIRVWQKAPKKVSELEAINESLEKYLGKAKE